MVNEAFTKQALRVLNELVALDRHAVQQLLEHRVQALGKMSDHPGIQLGERQSGPDLRTHPWLLGMMGIINAMCGTHEEGNLTGWGPICPLYDDSGNLCGFRPAAELIHITSQLRENIHHPR